uniref:Uncharacterized protein n=1 Tax=Cacopsylla melanoneura TaxID=428564 RepID=A0A8D9F0F0_9HEMI
MDTFVCPDQIRSMEQSRPSIRGLLVYSLVPISSLLQHSYGFVTYLQSVTVSTLKRKKNMIERIELYTVAIITYESIDIYWNRLQVKLRLRSSEMTNSAFYLTL